MTKMCPYCGNNSWGNSWGPGNAICRKCNKEFVVIFEQGQPVGCRIDEAVSAFAILRKEKMKIKAVEITTEGFVSEIELDDLASFQRVVGGFIEPVHMVMLPATMYVNEQMHKLGLPRNLTASRLAWDYSHLDRSSIILGNVIICGLPNREGDDTDVSETVLQLLLGSSVGN